MTPSLGLAPVDMALLAVLAVSAGVGVWRGFIYEAASLLGWVVAYFGAQRFGPWVAATAALEGWAPELGRAGSFLLVFIAILLAWALAAQQQRFASLAPLVFEHEHEDPAAQALLADAVQELAALARAVDPSGRLPIAWSGSIADRLASRLPPALRARSVAPQGDAMAGALLMVQHTLLNEMPA